MTLLRMAAGYRQSAEMIRLRIISLRDEARRAQPAERGRLEQRIGYSSPPQRPQMPAG